MQNTAAQVPVDLGCFSTIPEKQSPKRESLLLRLASDLSSFPAQLHDASRRIRGFVYFSI